jgi:hypothetical protein
MTTYTQLNGTSCSIDAAVTMFDKSNLKVLIPWGFELWQITGVSQRRAVARVLNAHGMALYVVLGGHAGRDLFGLHRYRGPFGAFAQATHFSTLRNISTGRFEPVC